VGVGVGMVGGVGVELGAGLLGGKWRWGFVIFGVMMVGSGLGEESGDLILSLKSYMTVG